MLKKCTYILSYGFGILSIFTVLLFYFQPNSLSNLFKENLLVLYNFLLSYFIVSGIISFAIVAIGGGLFFGKKIKFETVKYILLINAVAFILYILFAFTS